MNYNNGNDGDKLFEQRNESSVLFSLDSLMSQNSESGDDSDSPFGGSGDKSGLIDLNTLAEMGSSSHESDDYSSAAPVFNKVRSKKQNASIIIGVIVALLCIGAAVWYFAMYLPQQEQQREQALAAEKQKQQAALDELQAQLDQAKKDTLAAEAMAAQRVKDAQKVAEEVQKRQEEAERLKREEEQSQQAKPSTKSSGSSSSTASAAAASKPAAPKGKGPSPDAVKAALQASASKAGKCGKNGNLVVSMTLTGSGKAKNVTAASGSFKGTPTEKCILTVVEKHNFPPFSGADVSGVKYNDKL